MSPAKAGYFRKTASRQPGYTILCPVQSVSDQFKALGFSRVRSTPYPITPFPTVEGPSEFRHILFAGAARQDKGFHHVVDLAEYMNRNDIMVPFWIQTSPDHYDRYEESTQRDLSRLERIKQPWISIFPQTLGREGYEELYRGGICLQPYRREDFVERISGITLDALSLGCPVIVPGGTWMAGIIDRFGAGITLNRFSSKDLMDAVDAIRTNYHDFRDRALRAGSVLGNEYNARHLLYVLTEGI
jgi:glycosyltransferase involved in cell wall biosynthesis